MRIIGMMRVKDEARWIERVVRAALSACDEVVVFDDHSDDGTPEICRSIDRVTVHVSPFEGLDEVRDKNCMLGLITPLLPTHVLHIDGDEELAPGAAEHIHRAIRHPLFDAWRMRVLYLWDSRDQVRVDGVYGRFSRPSLFRFVQGRRFGATQHGGNFHCGNVPGPVRRIGDCGVRLLHYGYMERADRVRKFAWYNAHDAENRAEDGYRHIVQGDVPGVPASARLMHAGPLTLRPLSI
jgi:hypothetical protein